jgi:cyclophilin family peptidyl-prolyl cis-trans isomerase
MRISMFLSAFLAFLAAGPVLAQSVDQPPAATANDRPQVLIQTSMGDITLELDRGDAPITVDNFLRYTAEGHYDGTLIYRVAPHFVIQMGSYGADGQMRPVHAPIRLEASNGLKNIRGAVAMARETAPNSATAEFFIDLSSHPELDSEPGDPDRLGYAVFAHVVSGMDVVDKIAAVPLGGVGPMPHAAPLNPIVIEKVKLLP